MDEIETGIFKYNDNNKSIYVVGDIHGDYQCLVHCLVDLCNCCNITEIYNDEFDCVNREYLEWTNNNSIVVFCGDLIHRQRFDDTVLDDECSDIYIIKTLIRLKREAQQNGGDIILIAGNHEIMNILQPDEMIYTSKKNLKTNEKYFMDVKFINEYIQNSYAWIKINDILIAHGGLCSEYLTYIDSSEISGNDIIKFINNKYREFFTDFKFKNKKDVIGYNLFLDYDMENKSKHNMFWCREWGYSDVDCDNYKKILSKIKCTKMIIAHCPQFLSPDKPKMINFECKKSVKDDDYNLARIDLGMSRSFDYNKHDQFIFYLRNNYNRKMSVLKLNYINDYLCFNNDSIVTKKLSCIQYLLLKYGLKLKDWQEKNIKTDWIGFDYIDEIVNQILTNDTTISISDDSCSSKNKFNKEQQNTIIMCILYPLVNIDFNKIKSISQFNELLASHVVAGNKKYKFIRNK